MVELFVLAFLYIDDSILLLGRHNATFGDGLYSLVGGKVEHHETALGAIRREVQEEVALDIPESLFTLVHTFHRKGTDNDLIALVFKADVSRLPAPRNVEPEKHDDMQFFKLKALPYNMISAHRQALESMMVHLPYSQHGW